jgi:gluconokinase
MILILMGVSGVGKTTIGKLLSVRTGWPFEDADDYHSEENKRKMAAGIPLTDADRAPWLRALHQRMLQYRGNRENAIFACSALKEEYRRLLSDAFAPSEMRFVYLHAAASVIAERMKRRHHPYMNPELLQSQIAALEEPADAWRVSVEGTEHQAVREILTRLREAGRLSTGTEKK